ncbi:MAG: helix-turn-helix transcriptional regulator [Chitinophagales bacterium]
MKDEMKFIRPQKKLLQGKIKTYYFHQTDDIFYKNEITYYPNFTSTLNIYKNATVEWTAHERTHHYQKGDKPLILLVGKINKSRKIALFGPQNKITIVFEPLGLNYFTDIPLSQLIKEHFSFFDYYDIAFNNVISKVFEATNLEQKRDVLDDFFSQRFHVFSEKRLTIAIQHIIETEDNISISQLAQNLGISRRTLLRLFQKHLSYSIEEFLSVVKFRKALITAQSRSYNLTRVAMEANYYDQSDFIKNFKSKSGESPKQLLNNLKKIERELFWKLK